MIYKSTTHRRKARHRPQAVRLLEQLGDSEEAPARSIMFAARKRSTGCGARGGGNDDDETSDPLPLDRRDDTPPRADGSRTRWRVNFRKLNHRKFPWKMFQNILNTGTSPEKLQVLKLCSYVSWQILYTHQ